MTKELALTCECWRPATTQEADLLKSAEEINTLIVPSATGQTTWEQATPGTVQQKAILMKNCESTPSPSQAVLIVTSCVCECHHSVRVRVAHLGVSKERLDYASFS